MTGFGDPALQNPARGTLPFRGVCLFTHGPCDRDFVAKIMSKKTRWFAIIGVVLLVIFLVLYFSLGWVVKTAVNRVGPQITQSRVELAGARISPLTGHGVLTGLTVGNPAGWSSANAFHLGRISISLKPFSVFSDHIVIDEIDIDQPEFLYETKVLSSNIGDLIKNVGSGQGEQAAVDKKGRPVRFEVKHLRLAQGKVTLGMAGSQLPLALPTIELRDLGTKEGGITADQLAMAVMKSVSGEIVSAVATNAAGQLGSAADAVTAEGIKKAGESLKKLWGDKK